MEQILTLRAGLSQKFEELARTTLLRAHGSSRVNHAMASLKRSSDMKRIERLKQETNPTYQRDRYSAAKYADFHPWVVRNMHRAVQLGLHKSPRLRILDIGAGPGYFIAVARALGHECAAIDVPESYFSPLELRVYTELLTALNCREYVRPFAIQSFTPLSVSQERYDLITAFLICFNRHDKPDQWGVPEWRFFVEDAMEKLNDGGRLYLGINPNTKRYGKMSFYDEPLLAYFQSVGTVVGARVTIRKPAALRN